MITAQRRQMTLVAFLQAQNCTTYPASWRHAAAESDFLTAGYYQRLAQTLEAGKFHLAFFDDRLAMPDRYADDYTETVRSGIRAVKLDPIPLMTAMGLATRKLGIAGTYSTTYYKPFHVARVFATLDHLLGGRAAWNVVTSVNDSEAANFGQAAHLAHDARYDRADEFIQAVLGHWDTWEDDAVVYDRQAGVFADPAKVHRLDHRGAFFRTRGPFTVPRTPQGRPVVIQAGQSGRGRRFAARWGEVIFVVYHSRDLAAKGYREFKDSVAQAGRDPALLRILPAVHVVPAETRSLAEEKAAYIESLWQPMDSLVLLSEGMNYDFSTKALDEPFTDEELAAFGGFQGLRDRVVQVSGKRNPTTRDLLEFSGRGMFRNYPCFVGTAQDIADGLEDWFTSEACDGFVLAGTHVPGAYEGFVRLVVPELQRRGLFHREYAGTTLRENLGLPRAQRGDWVPRDAMPESEASRP